MTDEEFRAQLPPQQAAAFEHFCPTLPCLTVDAGHATEVLGLHTMPEALVAFGREPEDCPQALREYEARGAEVGAFLGRCPTAEEAVDLAQAYQRVAQDAERPDPVGSDAKDVR
jgi:hypothetical protein